MRQKCVRLLNLGLTGYLIRATGTWSDVDGGALQVRWPPEIVEGGIRIPAAIVGIVQGVGRMFDTGNCSARQTFYIVYDVNGKKSYDVYVAPSTALIGLPDSSLSFKRGDRVQVDGALRGNNSLQAQIVTLLPPKPLPDPGLDTITYGTISSGVIGDTFSCAGPIYSYGMTDDNGTYLNLEMRPDAQVETLAAGSRVQVKGLRSDGSILVSRIVSVPSTAR